MVLNDSTYCMDEGLDKLQMIKELNVIINY
jgi:hypothetical protein